MYNAAEIKSSVRIIIYFLMAMNALLIAWRVYQWSQGADKLYNIGTSVGFIFLFAALLTGKQNAALHYALFGAAVLCIVGSLVVMLAY